jgi:hypothetical protein
MRAEIDSLPVTVLLATVPGVPVTVLDGNAALRMAIVDRASIGTLGEEWDRPGVYVLLDPVALDGAYGAYVGKAPAGLRDRLRNHLRQKEHWARAVLVIRDTTYGWDSAQVGWLEGRLYDLLDGATLATLSNKMRPQDETVRPYDRAALEAATEPVAAILRLLGCSPDTFADEPPGPGPAPLATPASVSRKQYSVSVRDLITAGVLRAGERLSSTQRSAPATAVLEADGTLVVDGQRHSSPSTAGSAVRGGKATNGWIFWAVEREGSAVPLATIRARHLREAATD